MTSKNLLNLFSKSSRRSYLIGNRDNGVIAALDLEGRLFTVLNGKVLSRVVPSAIINRTNKLHYQNPGGDALWPAPEGSCFGYEYNTGNWRVPPSVTGAVWEVVSEGENKALIRAEIDLINNMQTGFPCEFERHIKIDLKNNILIQEVTELIRYIGKKTFERNEFLLAPWSLCQFDSERKGNVIFPVAEKNDVWDMYEPAIDQRKIENDLCTVNIHTHKRFQVGLSENIPWIEYNKGGLFRIRRYTDPLPSGQKYIDISDISPKKLPSTRGIRYSVYCDPSGFMEIEACGGCTTTLSSGTELSVKIITEFHHLAGTADL